MTGVLVLAAGGSSRMGRAKQLLPYRGTTFLRHAVETARATGLGPAVIVLGAEAEACRAELAGLDVRITVNAHWATGMGGSIAAGMAEFETLAPHLDGVLILLHDQPSISPANLRNLMDARWEDDLAVAARYGGIIGVPAWFRRDLFTELRQLTGQQGARKILDRHAARVRPFDLTEAGLDIDTPADYESLGETREAAADPPPL